MVCITNRTSPPTATGENKYTLCINRDELVEFTHNREDRLSILLRKAADAYDAKYCGMIQFGTGHEKSFEQGVEFILSKLYPK